MPNFVLNFFFLNFLFYSTNFANFLFLFPRFLHFFKYFLKDFRFLFLNLFLTFLRPESDFAIIYFFHLNFHLIKLIFTNFLKEKIPHFLVISVFLQNYFNFLNFLILKIHNHYIFFSILKYCLIMNCYFLLN